MLAFDANSSLFLRLTFDEIYGHLVNVFVFDHNNQMIESRSGNCREMVYLLSPGLYTLRLEMNGLIADEVFFMEKDRTYRIADKKQGAPDNVLQPPTQYSSALLGESYGSSHEYYTYPAIEWSAKDTGHLATNPAQPHNSSLYIFLRFPSLEYFNQIKLSLSIPFYSGFKIVDEEGNPISKFDALTDIVFNDDHGWLAFNESLKSGLYFLIYNGDEARQIPIYVYESWHTQFFMTLGKEPLFGTIRIFLSQNRIFDPEEPNHKYIDILLDKIQNKDYEIDEELIYIAGRGEFQSPMLGLICCYIYLKGRQTKNDDQFELMFYNLRHFILNQNISSPDIQALFILACYHFPGEKYQIREVQGTPMFRVGFEAILKASVEYPGFIPEYSLNDFISENLYSDSPYTTFEPVPFVNNIDVSISQNVSAGSPQRLEAKEKSAGTGFFENIGKTEMEGSPAPAPISPAAVPNEGTGAFADPYETNIVETLNDSLLNYIKDTPTDTSAGSWIKNSISELLQNQKDMSIHDISKKLGVSGNTVNRIFRQWKDAVERGK